MKRINKVIVLGCVVLLLPACAMQQKKVEKEMKQPINCATAEGDIRVLQNEKTHVAQQIIEGATSITPPGFVLGLLTQTEGTKISVAVGEYNKAIDKRIAEIKGKCGVE